MKITHEEMLVLYKKLPQKIKNYLASPENTDVVFNLSARQGFSTKQAAIISNEITSILYGTAPIQDLEKNLEKSLDVDKTKSITLGSEIRKMILFDLEKDIPKIQTDLKKIRKSHQDSEKEILNRELNISEKIKNYISSGNLQKNLSEAGIEFDLRPSKVIDLKNEILFVLVGLTGRNDFLQNLNQNLDLPKELTGKIATYVDQDIFKQFETELGQFEQLHKQAEQTPKEESVPVNLPVQEEGEEIPTFSEAENVMSKPQFQMPKMETEKTMTNDKFQMSKTEMEKMLTKSQYPISKPNETPVIKVQSKPQYQHPQSTPAVQGLSQDDITQNHPKAKPYVPPTRDFGYRDEKIGGVNIQKEESAEIDENINREDLLKDIENPTKSEPSGGNLRQSSYKEGDPYREPLE